MQYTGTITLPCPVSELSPYIEISCLEHNLVTISLNDSKLGMHVFCNTQSAVHKNHYSAPHLSASLSVCLSVCHAFCPEHNSKSYEGNLFKLHTKVEDVKGQCSVQEP